jgi:hypothetical protein
MSAATVAGYRCTRLRVWLPRVGVWWASCEIDEPAELSGRVAIVCADLSLSGMILSGGTWQGKARYQIAGGAGKWPTPIPAKSYANDLGVKRATILRDACTAAGETLDESTLPTGTVGPAWIREAGPASATLQLLAFEGWYVDEAGVTRIGARERADLAVETARVRVDQARGIVELKAQSLATLLPGVVVDGIEAVDVLHEIDAKEQRTTIRGAGASTRTGRASQWHDLIHQILPDLAFLGTYEYRVVSQSGERVALQAVGSALGLPDLANVRVRPGVAGARADLALGTLVLVAFIDADPARPAVVGFEDADGGGFAPTRLDLVGEDDAVTSPGDALGRVVRYGDPITFPSPGPGVIALPATGSLSRVFA